MKALFVMALAACGGAASVHKSPDFVEYATPRDKVAYESSVRLSVTCPGGDDRSGSGVAVSRRHILTAYHVVDCSGAKPIHIAVLLRYGAVVDMDVDAIDEDADVARLVSFPMKRPFSTYSEVRVNPLRVGEEVYSIGGDTPNIFGVKKTGYVTAIGVCQYQSWQPDPRKLPYWWHSSIPVVPGNSGSGVFDSRGRVVGIVNTWNGSFNREQGGGHFGVWAFWQLLPIAEMRWSML